MKCTRPWGHKLDAALRAFPAVQIPRNGPPRHRSDQPEQFQRKGYPTGTRRKADSPYRPDRIVALADVTTPSHLQAPCTKAAIAQKIRGP